MREGLKDMPNYDDIFLNKSSQYDALVSKEDYKNNLLRTLKAACPFNKGQIVADLGSGTGRMAFLLAPLVAHVYGIEPSDGMRRQAELKRVQLSARNIEFMKGDHRSIPLADRSVDVVVEGWAFGVVFFKAFPNWISTMNQIMKEVYRILKRNGSVVLIETMGTLHPWEAIPERVQILHDFFEKEHGFKKQTIRTDYMFETVDEAAELITFFFGDEMGKEVQDKGLRVVPEATAVWTKMAETN